MPRINFMHPEKVYPTPRILAPYLRRMLTKAPALLLYGARQTGLTTLARGLDPERTFIDLHDFRTLNVALRNPRRLLAQHPKAIIEGLAHAPPLLRAIRAELELGAQPGRFVLLGNRSTLRSHGDWRELTLKMQRVRVGPLTRRERLGGPPASLWGSLFEHGEQDWIELIDAASGPHEPWREAVQRSGMPLPALHLRGLQEQARYFDDLIRAAIEPDLSERLSRAHLPYVRRLWARLAEQVGERTHQSALATALGRPQPTLRRWLHHLIDAGMLTPVDGWRANPRAERVRAPRLYFFDTAFALHAAGYPKPRAAHLKNLIATELSATVDATGQRLALQHWTPYHGEGVDFLARMGGREIAVAVSTKSYPDLHDALGILNYWYEEPTPPEIERRLGLLLHVGRETRWVHPNLLAVPWWRLC